MSWPWDPGLHSLSCSSVSPGLSACKCGTAWSARCFACCSLLHNCHLSGSVHCHFMPGVCQPPPECPGSTHCHLAHPVPPLFVSRPLSAWPSNSAPPTDLDECVYFNSLVVGLPYSSISCQFWFLFCF
ncbi:hypothetical protein HJG60_008610 [Phyllostomus discolor]|uniref:Uncharacterized protein n=1 Tax=Phyllostomus discolor TaxID=89673 RepID=A0A833YZA2_9CHIR|nr:hypothetical protein HJG60_008610 [Phyllostomus discolor]